MANEYLKRQPTSTGNRKIWTWSGWLKTNLDSNGGAVFASDNGSRQVIIRFGRAGDVIQVGYWSGNIYTWDVRSSQVIRDCGSWYNLTVAVNTTALTSSDRVKIYLNGSLISDLGTSSYPSLNFETEIGRLQPHGIGAMAGGSAADVWLGNMTDCFFVDGQALTPDVFGFYKDGDGYISVGSTQATDFRPGQWSPHSPRKIKTEIERKGGFGVNGFYLPMNDSSNFGADFHTTPNSIITLKGEDLPQPRNGAPTTSDAYVSQLREDPYAANLVLAVPGISTATGANLVTNGTFDSDVSGWSVTGGTFTWNNGRAQHVTTGTNYPAYQQITGLTIGQRYTFQYTHYSGETAAYINTTPVSLGNILALGDTSGSSTIVKRGSFTATATSHYVVIYGLYSNTSIWDDVVVKQEDAPRDYSADIKGSGSNKTLTPNGAAGVGYEIPSYYGSAMTFDGTGDYLTHASNSDFAFGTDDFTIECWANFDDLSASLSDIITSGTQTGGFGLYCAVAVLSFVSQNNEIVSGTALTTGQWNHIVAERYGSTLTIYLNGVAVAADTTFAHTMTQNSIAIGAQVGGSDPIDGILQDLRVYKGVAKYKGGFDVPKLYTPVGIESWRQVSDTCKNNFATLNPLEGNGTLTDGNLTVTAGGIQSRDSTFATPGNGKWYAEFRTGDVQSGTWEVLGIHPINKISGPDRAYAANGQFWNGGAWVNFGTAWSDGDIIGVAYDQDNNQISFYLNGTLQVSSQSYSSSESHHFVTRGNTGSIFNCNFGQNPTFSGTVTAGTFTDSNGKGLFKYAPPTGFLALCEDNLPTPAIADPGEHFKTVLYTGSGSARAVTGVGFKPDLVWVKSRTNPATGIFNTLVDSVRGAPLALYSNSNDSEDAPGGVSSPASVHGGISSFDNDGFSIMSGSSDTFLNNSGTPYVAWCWKAGGAAVTNNDGTITSQVSANQTAGFSIVSYTGNGTSGATVGHGLNKTPKFIITKQRSTANHHWRTYHSSIGAQRSLYLDLDNAQSAVDAGFMNSTEPTTSVFSIGNDTNINENNQEHIAYCWAEIENFSKFGSYVGNASDDGTFVYCGFKPALVITKRTDGTSNWLIHDSSRDSVNPVMRALYTNEPDAEGSAVRVDFVSNGFKHRNADGGTANNYANDYIFMAFAESPFQMANAK